MIILGTLAFVLTVTLVPVMARFLNKKGLVDLPIARSSHDTPIPRGGGLVVIPVILLFWAYLLLSGLYIWPEKGTFSAVILCGAALCAFTWLDDHKPGGLRVRTRLAMQLLAVSIPLMLWPHDAGRLFPEFVPLGLERILMALAWVWFCNIYNFMDGINGVSGMEAICIAGGLLFYSHATAVDLPPGYDDLLLVVIGAAAGYLVWNARPVAKVFLGDVGSIGFGYCLGWVLFVFAAKGYMIPAVLVSLVYCMDPTLTVLKRAWQRKNIWEPHREFYFHRATVPGALSHLQCVGIILGINTILIFIGLACLRQYLSPIQGLLAGVILVSCLLIWFYWYGAKKGHISSPRPKAFRVERVGRVMLKRAKRKR